LKLPEGHRVIHFERIDSTNSEARRLVESGERGPLWIWADEQTIGRGRLGHTWISEPGNLYVTCLFQTWAPEVSAVQISFVAAIAVYEMVSKLVPGGGFLLKWPNDVLKGGAKFCGLLSEIVGANPTQIALGCGINLAHAPVLANYPVTCLGQKFKPQSVLSAFALEFWSWLEIWDEGRGFPAIRNAWLQRTVAVGQQVTLGGVAGTFDGLGVDGALLVQLDDGRQKSIYAGEVNFVDIDKMRLGRK
jgi:BirA family transcriptional regulator, biotin operon repressor / biotin---[acetyl-CoA-carboxylase] ligase